MKSVVDFRACVEGLGMRLPDPTINPVDGGRMSDVSVNGVTDPKVQNKGLQRLESKMGGAGSFVAVLTRDDRCIPAERGNRHRVICLTIA